MFRNSLIALAVSFTVSTAALAGTAVHSNAPIAPRRGVIMAAGQMTTARWLHTATLLRDGRVLIAGGGTESAEIYDSSKGTFASTNPMNASREMHSATLLPDGRVLIAGGRGESGSLSSAELYDPETETFISTGALLEDQSGHSATLLRDGKVLISGGQRGSQPLTAAAAELYDPATGTFSLAGTYASSGTLVEAGGPLIPTATLFADGRVLLVSENPPEVYDPASGAFGLTGRMMGAAYQYGIYWHTATSLNDGTVLVAGGNNDMSCTGFANAEVYDPASGAFSVVGQMNSPRDLHSATLLRDGTVLIAGGGSGWCQRSTLDNVELYDPATRSFVMAGVLTEKRAGHTATVLNNGSVLLAGGFAYWPFATLRSAELYVPAVSRKKTRGIRR